MKKSRFADSQIMVILEQHEANTVIAHLAHEYIQRQDGHHIPVAYQTRRQGRRREMGSLRSRSMVFQSSGHASARALARLPSEIRPIFSVRTPRWLASYSA